MSKEYFDVLDENGNKTGEIKLRTEVHKDGDWHRVVHIWIINSNGDILLQRRSPNKDSNPNMLDISCAGHISAGDESLISAIRELKEELNLDVQPEDLKFLATIKHSETYSPSFINNEFANMYILKTDIPIEKMTYQETELSEIFFVPYRKFKEMVRNEQPDLLMHTKEFKILFDMFDKEFDV